MPATINNAQILRRIYEEVMGQGRLEVLDEVTAKDCVDANPFPGQTPGLQGIRKAFEMWRVAFPDVRLTVENVIGDGEHACGSFRATGTHKGPMMGLAATNKTVTMSGMDFLTIRDGKVTHWRHNEDLFGMVAQMGVIDLGRMISAQTGATGGTPKPSEARANRR